jgi:outer membrane receptor protein involved in Fe transport
MNINVNGPVYARGDENNLDANGQIPGYAVVNLDTRYKFSGKVEFFARVNNLFDRSYANFGTLGRNVFTGPGNTFDGLNPVNEQFLGHGAPRGAWMGLRYSWP